MISKITNTPLVSNLFVQNKSNNLNSKNNKYNFNAGLACDTVSFSANPAKKITEEVVNKVFMKLCEDRLRSGRSLGIYGAKKGEVNLFIQEKKFGKKARLTLSNGDFKGRSYLDFDLKRTLKKNEIKPIDTDYTQEEAAKIINLYLD